MSTEEFRHKLSAIFSADVVGYSRLMRDDEEATIRTLTTYPTQLQKAVIMVSCIIDLMSTTDTA